MCVCVCVCVWGHLGDQVTHRPWEPVWNVWIYGALWKRAVGVSSPASDFQRPPTPTWSCSTPAGGRWVASHLQTNKNWLADVADIKHVAKLAGQRLKFCLDERTRTHTAHCFLMEAAGSPVREHTGDSVTCRRRSGWKSLCCRHIKLSFKALSSAHDDRVKPNPGAGLQLPLRTNQDSCGKQGGGDRQCGGAKHFFFKQN